MVECSNVLHVSYDVNGLNKVVVNRQKSSSVEWEKQYADCWTDRRLKVAECSEKPLAGDNPINDLREIRKVGDGSVGTGGIQC